MGRIILSDYGFKKHHFHCESEYRSEDNPSWFWAPEVFDGKREMKSDVWSLGITLMELAEGKNPFERCDEVEMKFTLLEDDPPSLSDATWSFLFRMFVNACVSKDVNERWSVGDLVDVGPCVRK